ncbi:hypothetical protein ACSYAD_36905, partial [Acaryochloris marina NIES-2412]|uniref:hypothetical protein n=1 Tax=Acaryochloris marina TaxID=155978 RepID=UPI0040586C82
SQEFAELGLEPQILDLAQRVNTLSQNLEPNSFVGLDELANVAFTRQEQQTLTQNLAHIAQSIDHIDQTIEQTLSQQRIRSIADA